MTKLVWFDQDPDFDPIDYDCDGFHSPGETLHFEDVFLAVLDVESDYRLDVEHGGLRFVYTGDGNPSEYRPEIEAAWENAEVLAREAGL